MPITLTHCSSCHALVNPSWRECFVCGRQVNEPVATPPVAPASEVIDRLLAMPLNQFQQEGDPMEIKVPWLDKPLWFVPIEADAEILTKEGISRGVIWTAFELIDLLTIPGVTKEQVRQVAMAKRIFEGTVEP